MIKMASVKYMQSRWTLSKKLDLLRLRYSSSVISQTVRWRENLSNTLQLSYCYSDRCNSKSRGNIVPPRDETDTYRLPGK